MAVHTPLAPKGPGRPSSAANGILKAQRARKHRLHGAFGGAGPVERTADADGSGHERLAQHVKTKIEMGQVLHGGVR